MLLDECIECVNVCTCVGLEMKNFVCEGIRALVSFKHLNWACTWITGYQYSRSAIYTLGSTFRLRLSHPYGCVLFLSQVILANPWASLVSTLGYGFPML